MSTIDSIALFTLVITNCNFSRKNTVQAEKQKHN
jgi:hypothetical protein